MKVRIIILCLVLAMCLSACSVAEDINVPTSQEIKPSENVVVETPKTSEVPETTETADDKSVVEEVEEALFGSYEDVLVEYSERLREATPILIEEYKEAAKENQEGLTGLATLCNEKVSELAVISNEGVQEMAELMLMKSSGSYEEYSEWADKLYDVYMEEASKIQDAYMDSAL